MSMTHSHPSLTRQQINDWMERGHAWLEELRTPSGLRASSAAGRYHALFGRDSLLSVMLVLEAARLRPADSAFRLWTTELAASTLQALAATQGTELRDENEEQPGKIVHEYWPEVVPAHLTGSNPENAWPLHNGRYYGSVDATYLFLLAAGMLWEQGPAGREVVERLWEHVLAALEWALTWGDVDGDGLIEVSSRQPRGLGLVNQVWKDSGDSLLLENGQVPPPPIAWIEVQGYASAAFRQMQALLQERGASAALQTRLADYLQRLEQGIERFWLPAEGYPAMVLTREKQAIALVSSNAGHALWCQALSGKAAEATARRLLSADMLTTWGIRTLSSQSAVFEPLSYHRGSVWPFDNAITAAALWKMGKREEACMIGRRVLDALISFDSPVELYCVLPAGWAKVQDSNGFESLLRYLEACDVQAWSVAALLLFCAQLLAEGSSVSL
ncbi:MAG TPA: amylo-alpha-1,6-glucosidase [Ktedonobacterales bacterium]|jgi:glycogen debranching enzyme